MCRVESLCSMGLKRPEILEVVQLNPELFALCSHGTKVALRKPTKSKSNAFPSAHDYHNHNQYNDRYDYYNDNDLLW